jgi:transcriptional regulator with XRE-family HTH domain
VTDEANRRTELGRFLRTRRERMDPTNAGFPLVGRRRTSGLRREEVAVLAGVSTTWYTYLEQGRNKNVSQAVLNSVARVLQFSDDEVRYMHFLAYGQMYDEVATDLISVSVTDLLSKVVATTNRHPYPVYVVDHRCDLIVWNPAATEWYDDWTKLPPENRNFLHWLFMSPRARQSIVGWVDFARDITARWRLEIARWPGDKIIEQRIRDLSLESPDFVRFWEEYSISEHHANTRRLRHPELGEKELLIFPLRTPYVSVPGIIYHFPALPDSAGPRPTPSLAINRQLSLPNYSFPSGQNNHGSMDAHQQHHGVAAIKKFRPLAKRAQNRVGFATTLCRYCLSTDMRVHI